MFCVCVRCRVPLKLTKAGAVAEEVLVQDNMTFRLFCCDVYQCPVCKEEILAGFGVPVYPNDNGTFENMKKQARYMFKYKGVPSNDSEVVKEGRPDDDQEEDS